MLSEHPSVKPEEIGELLEYYKKIVTRKLPAEVPVEKQHPELTYNRVAPWTFKPPVDFPGLELANRMDEDGNYADIPSKLRDDIASELQQLEELMSNLDRKK